MKSATLTIIVSLFLLNGVLAQDSLRTKHHLIFKIAPLSMFDLDNTFQFATEHRLRSNRWTLSEEFGYGNVKANIWGESFADSKFRETFRAKIELRRYKREQAFMGRYIAYEAFYKQINDRMNRNIGRECENGNCNYFEYANYPVNKYVIGLTAKLGYQLRIRDESKKNTKFVFDFYVGAGVRRIIVNHHYDQTLTSGSFTYYSDGIFSNSGLGYRDKAYNIPHLALGLKIGYIIF